MFKKLFANQLSPQEAKEFLIQLYQKGESAQEIALAARLMREHSIKLPIPPSLQEKLIDIVGTGGDRSNSFNISTTVALLLPALGSYVAKHGNRSVTSKSGSADMLEALGIRLDLSPSNQVKLLEKTGFCFIFAKNHHPIMKHIMPIRKEIPHRTIFNLLGPLTNPAGAKKYLLGVFSKEFIPKMAEALVELEVKKAIVISSEDGLDEASISAPTHFAKVKGKVIEYGVLTPQDAHLPYYPKEELIGGDPSQNAQITRAIFEGRLKGAKRDVVLLNSALALIVEGKVDNLKEGVEVAKEAIESRKALKKLEEIVEVSKELA